MLTQSWVRWFDQIRLADAATVGGKSTSPARVRNKMGLTNLRIMVPFCRRVAEGQAVIDAMAGHALKRGDHGVEIFVMGEIPNNVIEIDALAGLAGGLSIGSNNLTQLTLGVDRDWEIVAFDFDERDDGAITSFDGRDADGDRTGAPGSVAALAGPG
jgi:pyruvate, water dikinase